MAHNDKAHIGLRKEASEKIVDILHIYLASEVVYNLKIRNYHWNVEGIHFNDLHKFFENLYLSGIETVDEVAERIRMLGYHTHASMVKYLELTLIKEDEEISKPSREMIENLLSDNETFIKKLRDDIDAVGKLGDQGTEDFLTGLIQKHEKDAWMLRSLYRDVK